ncbi:hypothetical protein IEQ34_012719 [Dendrobium chrysotoxum]|uniref:C2H2-type domain-containing protein n=1 Tax=Dendrobium chrysotoxum TaxID=161865 RepID=A0AAV7GNZ5_DENCH|nr:hypothetical protein IEQ34_012719 [Dendrobium chrysotoxum]
MKPSVYEIRMEKRRDHEFKCKTCGRSFATYQALGGHRSGHTRPKDREEKTTEIKERVHRCSVCGLNFSTGQALGGHMRRHKLLDLLAAPMFDLNMIPLDDDHDDDDHYDEYSYAVRMNKRIGEFKCKTCGRSFATYQALGGHRTSHTRLKKLVETKKIKKEFHRCPICGIYFPMGQALGGHMRRHKDMVKELALSLCWPEERVARKSTIGLNLDLNSIPMDDDED